MNLSLVDFAWNCTFLRMLWMVFLVFVPLQPMHSLRSCILPMTVRWPPCVDRLTETMSISVFLMPFLQILLHLGADVFCICEGTHFRCIIWNDSRIPIEYPFCSFCIGFQLILLFTPSFRCISFTNHPVVAFSHSFAIQTILNRKGNGPSHPFSSLLAHIRKCSCVRIFNPNTPYKLFLTKIQAGHIYRFTPLPNEWRGTQRTMHPHPAQMIGRSCFCRITMPPPKLFHPSNYSHLLSPETDVVKIFCICPTEKHPCTRKA